MITEKEGIRGSGLAEVWTPRSNLMLGSVRGRTRMIDGVVHILKQEVPFANLITQVGDQYYGERAAGIASPPAQVTGMRLGTGSTAVAKTGAGAAIVTYVTGSNVAISGGFPTSSIPGSARRITWKGDWAAGVATASGIAEVVITNETPLTNVAGTAANTIARALISPVINKTALDVVAITWTHDLLGA